jgi:hypothetical protein
MICTQTVFSMTLATNSPNPADRDPSQVGSLTA